MKLSLYLCLNESDGGSSSRAVTKLSRCVCVFKRRGVLPRCVCVCLRGGVGSPGVCVFKPRGRRWVAPVPRAAPRLPQTGTTATAPRSGEHSWTASLPTARSRTERGKDRTATFQVSRRIWVILISYKSCIWKFLPHNSYNGLLYFINIPQFKYFSSIIITLLTT